MKPSKYGLVPANRPRITRDPSPPFRVRAAGEVGYLPKANAAIHQNPPASQTHPHSKLLDLRNVSNHNIHIRLTEYDTCQSIKAQTFYDKIGPETLTPVLLKDPWHYSHACGNSRCKSCNWWKAESGFVSNTTARRKVLTKAGQDVTCKSKNVVYCLECPICGMAYVGETSVQINTRMSQHRANIEGRGKGEDTVMAAHFNKLHGHIVTPVLTVLETMPSDCTTTERRIKEAEWIRVLNSAHPWGLNENLRGYGCINKYTDPLERKTNPWKPVIFPRVLRNPKRAKHKSALTPDQRMQNNQTILDSLTNPATTAASAYKSLNCIRVSYLWTLLEFTQQRLHEFNYSVYQKVATICLTKHKTKDVDRRKRKFIPIEYVNHVSDILAPEHLCRMLRRLCQQEQMSEHLKSLTFSRKLPPTLATYCFNYNQVLKKLSLTALRQIEHETL